MAWVLDEKHFALAEKWDRLAETEELLRKEIKENQATKSELMARVETMQRSLDSSTSPKPLASSTPFPAAHDVTTAEFRVSLPAASGGGGGIDVSIGRGQNVQNGDSSSPQPAAVFAGHYPYSPHSSGFLAKHPVSHVVFVRLYVLYFY